AAWSYISFIDAPEARRIRTETLIEAGMGQFVQPLLLHQLNINGRYDDILRRIPKELEDTYRIAFDGGIPEPYGKNCQYVYDQMNKPLGEITQSALVQDAIDRDQSDIGKAEARRILKAATEAINQRMLGILPPQQQKKRQEI